jgi:serine/threonine-protein kinase HipA
MSGQTAGPEDQQAFQRRLSVWLDGAPGRVGELSTQAAAAGAVSFAYDAAYLSHQQAVPLSVSLPLRVAAYADEETRVFFDNLLPEGERRRTEALARRIDPTDVFGLLEALGRECPGAVSVLPLEAPPIKAPGRLDVDYEVLSDGRMADLVEDTAAGRPTGERMRFSLAGVQQKLAVARDPVSGAFLLPRDGAPTTWLVKVEARQGEHKGIVANEALCVSVLQRLGLITVHAERSVIGGVPVLLVARYDRVIGPDRLVSRRHQEDAAQVLGVPRELKYEADAERAGLANKNRGFAGLLGRFAGATRSPGDARLQLLKAAHANWLLGNCDAHLKNFAIMHGLAELGRFGMGGHLGFGCDLAPFYDVVCVGAYPEVDQSLAMRIGRAAQWDEVERQDWLILAGQMFPGRRIGAGILGRQLDWLKDTAMAALPAIDAVVAEGVVTRGEAKPVRDIVGSRIRHLNRTLKWDIPADTDAPLRRGGGWAFS